MDQFSKWVEAKAVPKTGSESLKAWLSEVFSRLSLPREIVVDRGAEMESVVFKDFCSSLGIKLTFISPYHHQSNPVERFNRTLLNMLRTYVDEDQTTWDDHLHDVLFAYRATTHDAIKVSPFEALFGVVPRLPVDLKYGTDLMEPSGRRELIERMSVIRQHMRQDLSKAANIRSKKYNEAYKTTTPDLSEKDLVYMKRCGPGTKLSSVWIGPFRLVRQLSPVDWMIEGDGGKTKIVHVNLLKRSSDQSVQQLGILRSRGRPKKRN